MTSIKNYNDEIPVGSFRDPLADHQPQPVKCLATHRYSRIHLCSRYQRATVQLDWPNFQQNEIEGRGCRQDMNACCKTSP